MLRQRFPLPARDADADDSSGAPITPVRVARWAAVGLACAAIGAAIVTAIMWHIASEIPAPAAKANAHLTALKSGLATAGGIAALFGLVLAARRQHAAEVETVTTAASAAEERTVETYANIADALGSDRAAARIAALLAAERLGMTVPSQAQAVCSLLCAYLKLPFTPPDTTLEHPRGWTRHHQPPSDPEAALDELTVRLVAQGILIKHLRLQGAVDKRTGKDTLWQGMVIDLSEATLVGADFSGCVIGQVDFSKCVFFGTTSFRGCTFTRPAKFSCTTFNAEARFDRTLFRESADFNEASFAHAAEFTDVNFTWGAMWVDAEFHAQAPDFTGATIRAVTWDPPVQEIWPGPWRVRSDEGGYWLALPGTRSRRRPVAAVYATVTAPDAKLMGAGLVASPGLMGVPGGNANGGLLGHDPAPDPVPASAPSLGPASPP